MEKGYAAPIWMTFKQALEPKANVRKGEHGSLVVYADKITRTETDTDTGEESEHAIPFMKGYTVFNVEQIDGLPEGVITSLKEEHENSASRIFSNDRDCLVPHVHSRRTKGSVCLCRNEMALDVESVVGGCVS
jgi:antirestriction protein ArdC